MMSDLMCKRIRSMGVRNGEAKAICRDVAIWTSCSGEEWTVSRLKQLKTNAIQLMSGGCANWRGISHTGDLPKGSFRPLFREALRHKPGHKAWTRLINVCMAYSQYVSACPTSTQWQKFQSSAEVPMTAACKIAIMDQSREIQEHKPLDLDWARLSRAATRHLVPTDHDVTSCYGLPGKRAPEDGRTVPETSVSAWLRADLAAFEVREILRRNPSCDAVIRDFLSRHGLDLDVAMDQADRGLWGDSIGGVGKISFIQEPGYKLRAVANPRRTLQYCLYPLQRALFEVLREVPEDCTFEQTKGFSTIQRWLREGEEVYSVDLSDATNHFPWEVERAALERLGIPPEWIQFFEDCARGNWDVFDPTTRENRWLRWTKGQPLGLGPSFAAFAIAHHALLKCCQSECLIEKEDPGNYYILGDDVVIRGRDLAEKYLDALFLLECPVSTTKTLTSKLVAEFAGKVICSDSVVPTIKWRETSDNNFLELARMLGPQFLSTKSGLFQPRQLQVLRLVAEVPEEIGGLGWNPCGKPYSQRILEANEVFFNDSLSRRRMESAARKQLGLAARIAAMRFPLDGPEITYNQSEKTDWVAEPTLPSVPGVNRLTFEVFEGVSDGDLASAVDAAVGFVSYREPHLWQTTELQRWEKKLGLVLSTVPECTPVEVDSVEPVLVYCHYCERWHAAPACDDGEEWLEESDPRSGIPEGEEPPLTR